MWVTKEESGNEHRGSGVVCGRGRGNCLLIRHQTNSGLNNLCQPHQRGLHYITAQLCFLFLIRYPKTKNRGDTVFLKWNVRLDWWINHFSIFILFLRQNYSNEFKSARTVLRILSLKHPFWDTELIYMGAGRLICDAERTDWINQAIPSSVAKDTVMLTLSLVRQKHASSAKEIKLIVALN